MRLLKGLSLSVAAVMVIAGCNSSGGSGDTTVAAADVVLDGAAVDGYLNGATVCLDINGDGLCTIATEPTTNTDATGGYNLTMTAAEVATGAPLLVYGGIDVDTQEWFGGRLKAPVAASGTVNITPLTTMVESVVSNGASITDAEQQVADALGLADSTLVGEDPVALFNSGDNTVLEAALTIQKVVEVMATAAVTADGTLTQDDVIEDIFTDLADAITTVAAGTSTGITAIVTEASSTSTLIDADVVAVAQIIEDEVANIIAITTDISDASLLIDATAELVEEEVVAAVVANDTTTLVTDAETAVVTLPSVEEIAVANVFDAYSITITAGQTTEIITALGTQEPTAANIAALSVTSTIGTDTVIASLVTAINAAQLALELQAVEIYLASLSITGKSDAILEKINALSGYSNTLTEAEFVTLLRATSDADLIAIADELDPPAPVTVDSLSWVNISEVYTYWMDEENGIPYPARDRAIFNNGVLTLVDEAFYDISTGIWGTSVYPDDDYYLNQTTGEWVLFTGTENYTTSADGLTLTFTDTGEQVQIGSIQDVSGQTLMLDADLNLSVTFSTGAKKYNLLFKETQAGYELDWMPTIWDANGDTGVGFTSIPEFGANGGCVYYKEATQECVGFESTTQPTDTNGNLTIIDYSTGTETIVGTWTGTYLPGTAQVGVESVVTTISDATFLEGDEDFKFLTILGGYVWVGSHHPVGTTFEPEPWGDTYVNDIGAANIDAAIASHDFNTATPSNYFVAQTLYDVYYDINATAWYIDETVFGADGNVTITDVPGYSSGPGTYTVPYTVNTIDSVTIHDNDGTDYTYTCNETYTQCTYSVVGTAETGTLNMFTSLVDAQTFADTTPAP